jgi:hypothetical protein
MKRDRLEDLGRLYEKLNNILNNELFEHCESKHGLTPWLNQFAPLEDSYEVIHNRLRFVKDKLYECTQIAAGEDE